MQHVMSFAELTQEVQATRPTPRVDPMTPGRRKANEVRPSCFLHTWMMKLF